MKIDPKAYIVCTYKPRTGKNEGKDSNVTYAYRPTLEAAKAKADENILRKGVDMTTVIRNADYCLVYERSN